MGPAAAAMTVADELFASRCEPPVLDVGCGPGRFVEWLAARGWAALGIDVRTAAVAETASRGGSVLQRDVEDRLPAEGRWGTVLLADGNIGLGGYPQRLLARCHELLRDGGVALVEVEGSPAVVSSAGGAGFVTVEEWAVEGRVFLVLRRLS